MENNEFKCAACGGIFTKQWSEEEAIAERKENNWVDTACSIVCDDCYRDYLKV